MPDTTPSICEICSKEKNTGREGSLTQFVFRFDTCRCEFPSLAKFQKKFDHAGAAEEELQLSPASFPRERYSPVRELGRGAAGTVYLCKDKLLGKYVAVKVLNTVDAEKLLAFQHEAKATSRLNHPNIIMIRDFGATANGAPFMVIDYCEGLTLGQFYTYSQQAKARVARDKKAQLDREKQAAQQHAWSDKRLESSGAARLESFKSIQQEEPQPGCLSPKEVVEVFTAICRALTYAHKQGVYHRDIKPSNILLQREEGDSLRVRLIDFGIAAVKETAQDATIGQGKTIVGTPIYMSPDVALGRRYDARSEIYSLGCVMFEALSGRRPFQGENVLETLQMHAHAKPPLLSALCPGEEFKSLSKIVERCLEKDPQLRFQSAEEVRQSLESAIKYDTNESKELDHLAGKHRYKNWSQLASTISLYAVPLAVVAFLAGSLFIFIANPDFILSRLEGEKTDSSLSTESSLPADSKAPLAAAGNHHGGLKNTRAASKPEQSQLIFDKTVDAIPELEGGPVYLQKQRGEDFDNYMVQGHARSAEDLKVLHGKPYIKRLDLRFDDLTGDTCKELEALPLRRINLIGSELDEHTFVHLARIKSLVQISVAGCKGVTDDGVKQLSSLPNLLFLRLGDTEITDKSIDTFLKLGKLRELRMSGCMDITPEGLIKLQALKDLETITFRKCNVDHKLLDSLDKFKSLQYLGLSELDDGSIKFLLDSKINTLSIGDGHKLTDRGLIELAKLKSLRNLYLVPNNLVSNYGIGTFKRRNPRCLVEIGVPDAPGRML